MSNALEVFKLSSAVTIFIYTNTATTTIANNNGSNSNNNDILYYCFYCCHCMLQLQEYIQSNEDVYRKILLYEVRIRRFIVVGTVQCMLVYAVNDMQQFNVDSKVIEAYVVERMTLTYCS